MLYLRPNIKHFTEIIHNGPIHMYRRIIRMKKVQLQSLLQKNYVINFVVVVSFVVVVLSPNVIIVNYDYDRGIVLEVRVGTMGTVYFQTLLQNNYVNKRICLSASTTLAFTQSHID